MKRIRYGVTVAALTVGLGLAAAPTPAAAACPAILAEDPLCENYELLTGLLQSVLDEEAAAILSLPTSDLPEILDPPDPMEPLDFGISALLGDQEAAPAPFPDETFIGVNSATIDDDTGRYTVVSGGSAVDDRELGMVVVTRYGADSAPLSIKAVSAPGRTGAFEVVQADLSRCTLRAPDGTLWDFTYSDSHIVRR